MIETAVSDHGLVVAPHPAAAETGRMILIEGGNAYEAAVAMAATAAVARGDVAGLGGDGLWLAREPSGVVRAIDACGTPARGATRAGFGALGYDAIPRRGAMAALAAPGAVEGWRLALEIAAACGGRLPLKVLFADAIRLAREGVALSAGFAARLSEAAGDLKPQPGFAAAFFVDDRPLTAGDALVQPRLADALEHLARAGLNDFYAGDVGRELAADLERLGAPLTRDDLRRVDARLRRPLQVPLAGGIAYGARPQGLGALALLGIADRLGLADDRDAGFIHGLSEASTRAAHLRDRAEKDRDSDLDTALGADALQREADAVDPRRASPPELGFRGEGAWFGVVDAEGRAVSVVQTLHDPFGAGCLSLATGVLIHNGGAGLSLDPDAAHALEPGARPPLGVTPGLATLSARGDLLVFGGGAEAQAAAASRRIRFGRGVGDALGGPRGRLVHGALRVEPRFDGEALDRLERMGHRVELSGEAYDRAQGAAGLIARSASGRSEGGADPRDDGAALGL
ncbi:gamma-glutamyltransferase [Methylopila turkensis]|uniref:Gamma-glutamyltransferase n=1 Tax=Methylopila turkensis TaxID=1437816 RepID=A0A9W6JRW5_9HYPH|nr:gamma-glutamyltransferase [Methylopila turkensis]GLK80453.1 gamma-glutamyltransferase [Methylopila turkensis]